MDNAAFLHDDLAVRIDFGAPRLSFLISPASAKVKSGSDQVNSYIILGLTEKSAKLISLSNAFSGSKAQDRKNPVFGFWA
jgi:hypothetical protein